MTLLTLTFHNIFLPQKAEKIKIGTFECHPHFWTSLQQLSIRKQWFLFGQQKYHLLPTKFSRPNFHVLATLNNNIFNGIFTRRFMQYKKCQSARVEIIYQVYQSSNTKNVRYNIYVYICMFISFLRAFNNTF